MERRDVLSIVIRYAVLILLGLFNLWLFYALFTPLTVYPVFWILSLFDSASVLLEGNLIFFKGNYLSITSACVAGAAYYLLVILNLSTPMEIKRRIKSVGFLLLGFLVLNMIRILVFSALFISGYESFDLAHKMAWYFGSTILVVLLWFGNVWLFRIKNIPVYSDVNGLIGDVRR